MAEPKTKATKASVSAFLKRVEDPVRRADGLAVVEMMRKATKCEPKMWGPSIVGFGEYTYDYGKGKTAQWPVAAFSPRKSDLVLYILPEFAGREALVAKLGKCRTAVSCVYLKRLADVDTKALQKLIDVSVVEVRKRYPA